MKNKTMELFCTVTDIDKNCLEITDNSDRAYIVRKADVKSFVKQERVKQIENDC